MKIKRYLSRRKYLLEDNSEWEIPEEVEDTIGSSIYGLEGAPKIDVDTENNTWTVLTDEQIKATDEYLALIDVKEKQELLEKAQDYIAQSYDIIKKNALEIEVLKTKIEELKTELNPTNEMLWKIFKDELYNSDNLDLPALVNCVYISPSANGGVSACIRIKNKLQNAVILSTVLTLTVKRFRIGGMGNIASLPDYNYGMQIELFDSSDTKIQLLDESDTEQDYVQYSESPTLSDIMHVATAVTNVKLKLTIIPKALDPNNDPVKKAHLSAYSIIHSES